MYADHVVQERLSFGNDAVLVTRLHSWVALIHMLERQ